MYPFSVSSITIAHNPFRLVPKIPLEEFYCRYLFDIDFSAIHCTLKYLIALIAMREDMPL